MNKKGFTIVELLIVLGIIVILSGATLSIMQIQRARARDAARKADLDSLRKALELYYVDHVKYPESDDTFVCIESDTTFQAGMTNYMTGVPEDPLFASLGSPQCFNYKTKEEGQQYKVKVILEETGIIYEIHSEDGGDI